MAKNDWEDARWSIWIDIEGFSDLWTQGNLALAGLRALMSGIFAIGTRTYPSDPQRLFAHQFGDAFVIVSDFHERSLDRCAAIAVVLMRHVAAAGCLARAAIAEGDFADISGCFPTEVSNAARRTGDTDVVQIGSGLMTLLPVMGNALIKAHALDKSSPAKGSVLAISSENGHRLSDGFLRQPAGDAHTIIDWVHSQNDLIATVSRTSSTGTLSTPEIENAIGAYIRNHELRPQWIEGTLQFNSLHL
jgi:hypothetical protein